MRTLVTALALVLIGGGAALAADPAKISDTSSGKIWTDTDGMALYTYDKDSSGKTTCYDKCATNWPPLKASADAKAMGEWTVVDRTDGTKMWAYKGQPLYTYVGDTSAGDVTGDGKGGVWHVAKGD